MKIISTESNKGTWTKKVTCSECKAVLELEASDLKVYNTACFYAGETWEPQIGYSCGVCNSVNYLDDSKIPSGIRNNLYAKARSERR